mmetsp:Transcript_114440/g.199049  ORF Transcript_114440/g.199049 Transcript_114440/m.199049 type:complete len:301 (+) Transcript_114440:275-1177(+)
MTGTTGPKVTGIGAAVHRQTMKTFAPSRRSTGPSPRTRGRGLRRGASGSQTVSPAARRRRPSRESRRQRSARSWWRPCRRRWARRVRGTICWPTRIPTVALAERRRRRRRRTSRRRRSGATTVRTVIPPMAVRHPQQPLLLSTPCLLPSPRAAGPVAAPPQAHLPGSAAQSPLLAPRPDSAPQATPPQRGTLRGPPPTAVPRTVGQTVLGIRHHASPKGTQTQQTVTAGEEVMRIGGQSTETAVEIQGGVTGMEAWTETGTGAADQVRTGGMIKTCIAEEVTETEIGEASETWTGGVTET